MGENNLYLRQSDTRLNFTRSKQRLKTIRTSHNKMLELTGNKLIDSTNVSLVEVITLIKSGKTLQIPIKKGSGRFVNVKNKTGNKNLLQKVIQFDVAPDANLTALDINNYFLSKETKTAS